MEQVIHDAKESAREPATWMPVAAAAAILPVSSAMKFRGKPAIDTLYVRLGDGLAAITVLIGVQFLELSRTSFFDFNVFLVLCWLVAGVLLVRETSTCISG